MQAARRAAEAGEDKKARDVALYDVRPLGLAEVCVLMTVDSKPQLRAVLDHVEDSLQERFNVRPLRREGRGDGAWCVLDYGRMLIHIMHPTVRDFYALERLWEKAKPLTLKTSTSPRPARS